MDNFIEELKEKTHSNVPGLLHVRELIYYDPDLPNIVELGRASFSICQLKELIKHMEQK